MAKFPNHLKVFRLASGLSQPELAKAAGVENVQNVSRIERGERKLTQEWADRFAPALKITPQELMFPSPDLLEKARRRAEPRDLEVVSLESERWHETPDGDG